SSSEVILAVRRIDGDRHGHLAWRYGIAGLGTDHLRKILKGFIDLRITVGTACQNTIAIGLIILKGFAIVLPFIDVDEAVDGYVNTSDKFKIFGILVGVTSEHQVQGVLGCYVRPGHYGRPRHIDPFKLRTRLCPNGRRHSGCVNSPAVIVIAYDSVVVYEVFGVQSVVGEGKRVQHPADFGCGWTRKTLTTQHLILIRRRKL